MEYRFLIETTKIENASFPLKNALSKANVKTNRGVFLAISKAFDKVWHKGIISKLQQNGISGKLIRVLCDFLKDRKQRVILNGKVSL